MDLCLLSSSFVHTAVTWISSKSQRYRNALGWACGYRRIGSDARTCPFRRYCTSLSPRLLRTKPRALNLITANQQVEGCLLEWLTSSSNSAAQNTQFYNIPGEHEGTLHLMAHHLLFTQRTHQTEYWLSYASMWTIDRKPALTVNDVFHGYTHTFYPIVLQCRHLLTVRLYLPSFHQAQEVFSSLQGLVYAGEFQPWTEWMVLC